MSVSDNELLLLEFPEQFETERLIIRAPQWGDGAVVNAAIRESFEELRQWMPWAQQLPTVDETEANIRNARLRFLERMELRLHLLVKETGQFIGCSGLHRIDWRNRGFEIGYWLRTSQTGRGWMTEAVHGITRFAADELQANRVEIRCDARNDLSRRVAERCGFTLEGILRREDTDVNGLPRDTMVFSKVRGIEL
ncbi:GNAT family N-acetyltransferase [Paenibacillus sp. J2TS4]|uniref:GNAT family N-acetyltransferase n=1 Tax=Paenibacillus sp. J2TS4 TaxID=2807194 RepID=UPI001B2E205E|nr:GNAT family N-acetyltransferase [Paenibacillus sp. J2TS4]GIP33937.1 ribosomal-protein-serine acetyltransferase [Paenibacillus sp. J2TS4]